MKANGKKVSKSDTAKEPKSGQMEQYMKDGSLTISHTVKDAYLSHLEMYIQVIGRKASTMDLVSMYIIMAKNMKENGTKIVNTEKVLKLG